MAAVLTKPFLVVAVFARGEPVKVPDAGRGRRSVESAERLVEFWVHVRAGSRRAAVGGGFDGALVVRVSVPAERGRANEAVRRALAGAFDVRRADVAILSGHTARRKRIRITGEAEELPARLRSLLGDSG